MSAKFDSSVCLFRNTFRHGNYVQIGSKEIGIGVGVDKVRVHVTGLTGWIGGHVETVLRERGHDIVSDENPTAVIHLAWGGLYDYENEAQFENLIWQWPILKRFSKEGMKNLVVAGSIWETCENPPPYVQAKLALFAYIKEMPIILKWVRAPYLYGDRQGSHCLLPALRRAVERGDKEFHVVNAALPFMDVREYARRLVDALDDDRNQVANLAGTTMRVADFCRQQVPESAGMTFIEDYPLRAWEK